MRRRRTLITSPLEWQMTALPVAHPALPGVAERGGTQLRTPRPVVIVDTREQNPFSFARFQGWFAGVEKKPLALGDYSVSGLEESCVVERKDLNDLVRSFTVERPVFVERLRRMSAFPDRLLVITAALSQVKSRYERRRNRCLVPVSGPSLPLARVQRPRPPPLRRRFVTPDSNSGLSGS